MNVLALDLATNTGWATSSGLSGVQKFEIKRGESPGMRYLRIRAWLKEMMKLCGRFHLIVFEKAHHRGGHATQVGVGLITEVLAFAAKHNTDTMPVPSTTLKKASTGKGNASKDDMVAAAKRFVPHVSDDNEADAILLLEYAKKELAIS